MMGLPIRLNPAQIDSVDLFAKKKTDSVDLFFPFVLISGLHIIVAKVCHE